MIGTADRSGNKTSVRDPVRNPVINTPFEQPQRYWQLDTNNRAMNKIRAGRRPSIGLLPVPATKGSASGQQEMEIDPGMMNATVNAIRDAVDRWRMSGYTGATRVSKQLLWHWRSDSNQKRLFFAQVEAMETLIWLTEAAGGKHRLRERVENASRFHNGGSRRNGTTGGSANEDTDGTETASRSGSGVSEGIVRYAIKMATGTGKTAVMGMVIVWQTANAASRRSGNGRYHTSFLAITPGHTVRERLAVLKPSHKDNIYDEMGLVPRGMRSALNRAKVQIVNFQAFQRRDWLGSATGDIRRLLRRGSKETELERPSAMLERVLRDIYSSKHGRLRKICVLNDEAHHCYLPEAGERTGADKNDDTQAALWFNAIAALAHENRLGPVYDFSATPMFINTAARKKSVMFPWVVSDFPLMDAIEAGLVKIPRVPLKDDTSDLELKWRNLYKQTHPKKIVRDSVPSTLAGALDALYRQYESTFGAWQELNMPTPPVFIVVANNIPNADALYQHLSGWSVADKNGTVVHQTGACDLFSNYVTESGTELAKPGPLRSLLVHSKLENDDNIGAKSRLGKAMRAQADQLRAANPAFAKKSDKEVMREALNTVGRQGELGEQIRCVVSVSMLTEGWDTRTVTHILGFRAFSTQLLCEQVTGRALRRSNYDSFNKNGRLAPEFADVLGVPYDFMPADGSTSKSVPKERYRVRTMPGRAALRIEFPSLNGYVVEPESQKFGLDSDKVRRFAVKPRGVTETELGGVVGDTETIRRTPGSIRRQQIEMHLAAEVTDRLNRALAEQHNTDSDTAQLMMPRRFGLFCHSVKAVQGWLGLPQVHWEHEEDLAWLLSDTELKQRAVSQIKQACLGSLASGDAQVLGCFDVPASRNTDSVDFETSLTERYPPAGTDTTTIRSELNVAACHSGLEKQTAALLDTHPDVRAWARNFRLDWSVPYEHDGVWHQYTPDFVVRLFGDRHSNNVVHLIVECKGMPDSLSELKHKYVRKWWIPAVRNSPQVPPWMSNWAFVELRHHDTLSEDLNEAINNARPAQSGVSHPAKRHYETALAATTRN